MTSYQDIVAVGMARTPMGKFGGSLKDTSVHELGRAVLKEALKRAGITGAMLNEVIFGCCRQAGNGPNPARTASVMAEIPIEVPVFTLNMACPSAMKSLDLAAQSLVLHPEGFAAAGGMDSMSTIPHLLKAHRWRGFKMGPVSLEDGWSDSVDPLIGQSMGETAENLVDKYQLSREDLDQLALESHQKAFRAQSAGLFDDEIVHLSLPGGGKSGDILFQKDETIRPDCDLEKLGVLKTSFKKDGKITAGNSCGLSDGASAVILCERKTAKDLGIKPLFSLVSFAQAAAEPVLMGEGPGIVMPLALRKAGLTLSDMDLLEVNEAFSAQILVNERQMKWDRDRLNVHGGAIALGHPTGSSGARILITGYHALKARDKEFLLAGICGGGGVTTAMIIKRENDSV